MYLRHTFVAVYVLENGRVIDGHKHWMEAAGQSEHAWFVAGLENPKVYRIQQQALGPENSTPCRRKQRDTKPQRSEALRTMLGAPLHENSQLPFQPSESIDLPLADAGSFAAAGISSAAEPEGESHGVEEVQQASRNPEQQ